eukprot:TRINITY_DN4316_c0_g2_i3.p1 TRINITY_DN4316_c0_g2~~TRINITY_DN4316_c0_g2_i3.p1  ORF type:complete len:736 (+),score=219.63 TRINITY_DN4316_c0_g2_i3:173-2209(+)
MGAQASKSPQARALLSRFRQLDSDGDGKVELRRALALLRQCRDIEGMEVAECERAEAATRIQLDEGVLHLPTSALVKSECVRTMLLTAGTDLSELLMSCPGTSRLRFSRMLETISNILVEKQQHMLLRRYYAKLDPRKRPTVSRMVSPARQQEPGSPETRFSESIKPVREPVSRQVSDVVLMDAPNPPKPLRRVERPRPGSVSLEAWPDGLDAEEGETFEETEATFVAMPSMPDPHHLHADSVVMERSAKEQTMPVWREPRHTEAGAAGGSSDTLLKEGRAAEDADRESDRMAIIKEMARTRAKRQAELENKKNNTQTTTTSSDDRSNVLSSPAESRGRAHLTFQPREKDSHNGSFAGGQLMFDDIKMRRSIDSSTDGHHSGGLAAMHMRQEASPPRHGVPPRVADVYKKPQTRPAPKREFRPRSPYLGGGFRGPAKEVQSPSQAATLARQRAAGYRAANKPQAVPKARTTPRMYRETKASRLRRSNGGMHPRDMKTNILKKWIAESEQALSGNFYENPTPAYGVKHQQRKESHYDAQPTLQNMSDPRAGRGNHREAYSGNGQIRRPNVHQGLPPRPPVEEHDDRHFDYDRHDYDRGQEYDRQSHNSSYYTQDTRGGGGGSAFGQRPSPHSPPTRPQGRPTSLVIGPPTVVSIKGTKQHSPRPSPYHSPRGSQMSSSY